MLDTLRGISDLSEEVGAVSAVKRHGCWLLRSVLRFIFEKAVNKKIENGSGQSHQIDMWAGKSVKHSRNSVYLPDRK